MSEKKEEEEEDEFSWITEGYNESVISIYYKICNI